jgi:hypothetical protein
VRIRRNAYLLAAAAAACLGLVAWLVTSALHHRAAAHRLARGEVALADLRVSGVTPAADSTSCTTSRDVRCFETKLNVSDVAGLLAQLVAADSSKSCSTLLCVIRGHLAGQAVGISVFPKVLPRTATVPPGAEPVFPGGHTYSIGCRITVALIRH